MTILIWCAQEDMYRYKIKSWTFAVTVAFRRVSCSTARVNSKMTPQAFRPSRLKWNTALHSCSVYKRVPQNLLTNSNRHFPRSLFTEARRGDMIFEPISFTVARECCDGWRRPSCSCCTLKSKECPDCPSSLGSRPSISLHSHPEWQTRISVSNYFN